MHLWFLPARCKMKNEALSRAGNACLTGHSACRLRNGRNSSVRLPEFDGRCFPDFDIGSLKFGKTGTAPGDVPADPSMRYSCVLGSTSKRSGSFSLFLMSQGTKAFQKTKPPLDVLLHMPGRPLTLRVQAISLDRPLRRRSSPLLSSPPH